MLAASCPVARVNAIACRRRGNHVGVLVFPPFYVLIPTYLILEMLPILDDRESVSDSDHDALAVQ